VEGEEGVSQDGVWYETVLKIFYTNESEGQTVFVIAHDASI
jgi:hypothetical protein